MSFYLKKQRNNGVEKVGFGGVFKNDKLVRREKTYRILSTSIIYNPEEEYYDTIATCVNEDNVIETISLEGFDIHENVLDLKGAYIDYEEYEEDYEEYEEDSEVNCTGTIYYL